MHFCRAAIVHIRTCFKVITKTTRHYNGGLFLFCQYPVNTGSAAVDNIAVMPAVVQLIKSIYAKALAVRKNCLRAILHRFKVCIARFALPVAQRKIQMLRQRRHFIRQRKILKLRIPQRTAHARCAAEQIRFVKRIHRKQTCQRIPRQSAPQSLPRYMCFRLRHNALSHSF